MQFAIMASTLIAILLLSFLMLTHIHSIFKTQQEFFLQTIEITNQNILKENHTQLTETIITDDNLKSTVHKSYWGAFEKREANTELNGFTYNKKALLGTKAEQPFTGVFLSDNNQPLIVAGSSVIEGIAYVSERGISPGIISGNYFSGSLPKGNEIRKSPGKLPQFDPLWKNSHKVLLEYIPSINDITISPDIEVKNSFFENPQYIYMNDRWVIAENYTGHLILRSETEIVVSKHANLTDVMVVAPKITIESGFEGNAYFLASEHLIVEGDVVINYPSSLILYDSSKIEDPGTPSDSPHIQVSENAHVQGVVVYLTERSQEYHTKTNISIAPKALIEGELYCEGNIEMYGTVQGTVYAHRFVTNKFGSIYVNHIFNGSILGKTLSEKYCGLPFENTSKNVVKWLY